MQTIDLSWITDDDVKAAYQRLQTEYAFELDNWGNIGPSIIYKDLFGWPKVSFSIRVCFHPELGDFSIRIMSRGIELAALDAPLTHYPVSLESLEVTPEDPPYTNPTNLEQFTDKIDKFNEANRQIIKSISARSKEDFYDDASDYQDDEPTDFGDASNYDENLVRRIRKVIE